VPLLVGQIGEQLKKANASGFDPEQMCEEPALIVTYKIPSRHPQHFKNGNTEDNDKDQHAP